MVYFEGIFFDKDTIKLLHSLETKTLAKINGHFHCTFKYRPKDEEIFDNIVGKSFEIVLVGYGNDGINSGFEVAFSNELKPYYINYVDQNHKVLRTPHITVSLAEGAIPENTRNLKFVPLKKPIKLRGKFGYWIKDETGEYLSFRAYNKKKKFK